MLQIGKVKLEELLLDEKSLNEIREYLQSQNFSLNHMAKIAEIDDPVEILSAAVATSLGYGDLKANSTLAVIARLFVFGYSVSAESFEEHLPVRIREILLRHAFVVTNSFNEIQSQVALLEYEGFYFLSDKLFSIGKDAVPEVNDESDAVWPMAVWSITLYQKLSKSDQWKTFLDVGCGTGCMAILVHKRYSKVVGIDLNPRSILFSKINAKINQVKNVSFMEANCFDWSIQTRFDHLSFAVPSGPSLAKSGAMVTYGGELGHELALRFLREGVDLNLSEQGCSELWAVFTVNRKYGSVLNLIKSSVPNLKLSLTVEEMNSGGLYLSGEDIESGQLPFMSHYSGHGNEQFLRRLKELQICQVTPALVKLISG